MPDLVGKYWADAEPQLQSLGWAGVLNKGPDLPAAPAERNRILAQDPPAGQHLDADGVITLRFGS
jgi:eukaryotic-like serine/threonine-protein kinase